MGCIGSRLSLTRSLSLPTRARRNSRRENVFPVHNVDSEGLQCCTGKLEVTESHLMLHVRGKPSLTWPLRYLRRYGYENDIFSFESGRRCPTGHGIFAFRCNRARSLFNLLQSKIQNNPPTAPNTVPTTPLSPTGSNPSNNPSTPVSSTFVYVNLAGENTSGSRNPNPRPDVTQVHPSSRDPLGGYSSEGGGVGVGPVYMNVDGLNFNFNHLGGGKRGSQSSSSQSQQYYVNAERKLSGQLSYPGILEGGGCGGGVSPSYTNVMMSSSSADNKGGPLQGILAHSHYVENEPAEVNYAELDLKTDNNCSSPGTSTNPSNTTTNKGRFSNGKATPTSTSSTTESKFKLKFSPHKTLNGVGSISGTGGGAIGGILGGGGVLTSPTENESEKGELGYATIDFDRTMALSAVTRTKINLDCYATSPTEEEEQRANNTTSKASRTSSASSSFMMRRGRNNSTAL